MRLTPEEIAFFKEYGYLMKKQVMDLDLCARARDEFWKSMPPSHPIKRDDPSVPSQATARARLLVISDR